jgi:hypothetical protein
MHDVVLVEYLEGIDELFEDKKCCFLRDDSILAQHAFECPSVAILIDEIEVIGSLEHVDILDDMLILLDVCQYVDFVNRAFL